MKPSQDIKPVTYLKTNSGDALEYVSQNKRPLVITQHGEARAVMIDIETYEKSQDTTFLLKLIAQGVAEAEAGKLISHETVMKSLRKELT
jgi:prevent-host-death family protein